MFEVTKTIDGCNARSGILTTAHGKIETPFLMPVATKGAAKLISFQDLEKTGLRCLIANSFLLYLKPGLDVIERAGGLHKFMHWDHGVFTDSGGFQVLSSRFLIESNPEEVILKNPFNGSPLKLNAELAMKIQSSLGSDVAMVLDDLPPHHFSEEQLVASVKKTIYWAERCKKAHSNEKQMLFGIGQGSLNIDLRLKCLKKLIELDFDGLAFGGLSIGESPDAMHNVIQKCINIMPAQKPRYLMGLGTPLEILDSVELGLDIFDSCYPTRVARHGTLLTSTGKINIYTSQFKFDQKPLDESCDCFVCKNHSRSYLHHLIRCKEPSGEMLASYHNVFFMAKLMENIRLSIKENSFKEFKQSFISKYIKKES